MTKAGAPGQRRRGLLVSLMIHALLAVVLVFVPGSAHRQAKSLPRIDVVFYAPPPPAQVIPEPPVVTARPPPPEPQPVERIESRLPSSEPRTRVVRRPALPKLEVSPPPIASANLPEPEARPVEVLRTPPPERISAADRLARREVFGSSEAVSERSRDDRGARSVGAFDTATPQPETPGAETRRVAASTFDGGPVSAPERNRGARAIASTTSFDGDAPTVSPPRGDRDPRTVSIASFDRGIATTESTSAGTRVSTFTPGGFGDVIAVVETPRPDRPPETRPHDPVEILSKQKPAYTAEARRLRVEGEVTLEVLFEATGKLRVIRVLQGLGHGLDEAAVEAALSIRFKPARRHGRPIDHRATLRVVFQLA